MTSVSVYLAMLMLGSNVSPAAVPKPPEVAVVAAAATAPAAASLAAAIPNVPLPPVGPPDAVSAAAAAAMPTVAASAPVAVAPTANAVAAAPAAPVTAAAVMASAVATTSTVRQVGGIQITDEEQRFIDLVNYERASRGLNVLRVDPLLVEVSRGHSKEMSDLNYFDHVSPTPGMKTALNRYLAAAKHRPTWAYLGENLFYCSIVDVNRGHTCLMESHSHRENILNPKFERIGVGVYSNDKGEFYVTQMFISSID